MSQAPSRMASDTIRLGEKLGPKRKYPRAVSIRSLFWSLHQVWTARLHTYERAVWTALAGSRQIKVASPRQIWQVLHHYHLPKEALKHNEPTIRMVDHRHTLLLRLLVVLVLQIQIRVSHAQFGFVNKDRAAASGEAAAWDRR